MLFFLFKTHVFLDSSFGIYLIGDQALLFFYLLSIGFFTDFKNDSVILSLFTCRSLLNLYFFLKKMYFQI